MKKTLLALALSSFVLTANAHEVITRTLNQVGVHGYTTNVFSDHGVKLRNNSDYPQTYKVWFILCVDGVKNCTRWENDYKLAPHTGVPHGKEYTEALRIFLPYNFKNAGNYVIRSTTMIEGEGAIRDDYTANLWIS